MAKNTAQEIFDQIASGNISPELEKILAQKADDNFRERKAREDSKFLSKASQWITSAWEIMQLIGTLSSNKCLVIDADGNIYRTSVSEERLKKMTKLSQKVPQRVPSNWDDGEITWGKFLKNHPMEDSGVVGTGFSHEWESSIRKATEKNPTPFVEIFMMLQNGREISYETVTTSWGDNLTKYSIKELDMFITVNKRGNLVQYGTGHEIVTVDQGKK